MALTIKKKINSFTRWYKYLSYRKISNKSSKIQTMCDDTIKSTLINSLAYAIYSL